MVTEGLEEGDAGFLQLGEDLRLADGVVRLDAVSLRDDFKGTVFVPVDLGCDAAGDVLAALIRAYPLSILLISIVIVVSGDRVRRS